MLKCDVRVAKLYCINTLSPLRVGDCCLKPTRQFFSYIMARTSQFSMRWWWWCGPLCTRTIRL